MSQIKQEIVVNWETFFWSAYPDKVLSYKTTEVLWSSYHLSNQLSTSNGIPSLTEPSLAAGEHLTDCHGRVNQSYSLWQQCKVKSKGFVSSPLFFSLPAVSRLSCVGWHNVFSRPFVFHSLYYPWGKMRTTCSLNLSRSFVLPM